MPTSLIKCTASVLGCQLLCLGELEAGDMYRLGRVREGGCQFGCQQQHGMTQHGLNVHWLFVCAAGA